MKILAIDTSTELCSVGLYINGETIHQQQFAEQQHAELIFSMLRSILSESGLSLNQIDYLAFGNGPGSFTGLRIATGVIQGLALGADIPVISISTLEALAFQSKHAFVMSCLDARIGELYTAFYHYNDIYNPNSVHIISPSEIQKPNEIILPESHKEVSWIGCGTGFSAYPHLIQNYEKIHAYQQDNLYPKAETIAVIASYRIDLATDAEFALPVYIRDKVALTIKERKEKQNYKFNN